MQLYDLEREDRLRLMRFICSFAWADLDVADSEKSMVRRMMTNFHFNEEETAQVEAWLVRPPPAEEVDPTDIPHEHRQIFLTAALQMVGADGNVDPHEMETLTLFEQLMR